MPTPTTTGVPDVNVERWLDTLVTLSAGAPDVNIQSTDDIALSTTQKSDVNTEVLDVLDTDTFVELGAVPAATSTLVDKINWIFALARNKITQTSTTLTLRDDADAGDIAASTVSDAAGTATRGEFT